jgi:ElaB/YqjD/DUF883 family membrane-anchored ribosome-binding protein|tara:strand:+ start:164 stop:508 length:345 start_codon:yes stop_codon:yes gene_type:complete
LATPSGTSKQVKEIEMAAEKTTQPAAKDAELAASKAAVGEAYEKLLEARDHFKAAAQAAGMDVRQDALEQLLKGREKAEALGDQATSYVREKPLATLGIAFAAGFVLAQLFSRK